FVILHYWRSDREMGESAFTASVSILLVPPRAFSLSESLFELTDALRKQLCRRQPNEIEIQSATQVTRSAAADSRDPRVGGQPMAGPVQGPRTAPTQPTRHTGARGW